MQRQISTSQLLQAPTEGSLYAVERRNRLYAAIALPLGDFLNIGLKGTMWDTMLWRFCPKGYTYNEACRIIRRNEEYQASSHQQHPVMFFSRASAWYEWAETKHFKPLSEFCDGKKVCNYRMAMKFGISREDVRLDQQSIVKCDALPSYGSVNHVAEIDARPKSDDDSEVEDANDSDYEPGNYDDEDWHRGKQPERRCTAPHMPQLALTRNCNGMPCANMPPYVANYMHKITCKNVATETSYVEAAAPHDENTNSQPLRPFVCDKELIEKDYLGVFQRVHFFQSENEKNREWATIPPILSIFQELNERNPQADGLGTQTSSSKSTLASLTPPRKGDA